MTDDRGASVATLQSPAWMLSIDGGGAWLLWTASSLAIGHAAPGGAAEERWRIYADIERLHAVLHRDEEQYVLEPRGPLQLDGRLRSAPGALGREHVIQCGLELRLRFQRRSPLSNSATITFESEHQSAPRVDGVVLFDRTCLIGPSPQDQISCPRWDCSGVLFSRGEELWWKMRRPGATPQPVRTGEVLDVEFGRLRLEPFSVNT